MRTPPGVAPGALLPKERPVVGMSLAAQVLTLRPSWGISDRAAIVLLRMAVSALDRDRAGQDGRLYFGGWEPLAFALGFQDYGRGSAAEHAVARACRELADAGLIKRLPEPTGRRRTAVYSLTLTGGFP